MNEAEFKQSIETMVNGYAHCLTTANAVGVQLTEESARTITISAYIGATQRKPSAGNSNYQSSGGGGNSGGSSSYNKPDGQTMQVGVPCLACNNPLKQSKKGNPYCACWFND